MVNPSSRKPVSSALTIDVEDYFHVEAFAHQIRPSDWAAFPSRVEHNTDRLIELLADYNTRATFFVLGWVAERFPSIVRKIAKAGHEVACHSYWHRPLWRLSPQEFAADTVGAKRVLEDITGNRVIGYRAPTFSVTKQTLWSLGVLAELDFKYDSSIFPIRHDRYGFPSAKRVPHIWRTEGGRQIMEFPLPTVRVVGFNLPVAGGGYLRLLPFSWVSRALKYITEEERTPAVVYVHPWEIDPTQPRLPCSRLTRFRHYHNLDRTEGRLKCLLSSFRFGTLQALYEEQMSVHRLSPAASLDATRALGELAS